MSSRFVKILKRHMGEKLTFIEKLSLFQHDVWRYWWGFSHMRDAYYNLKNLFWSRHDLIRTGLSKTQYCDKPEKLLYGIMNTVVDFVEIEKCFDSVDFYNNGTSWSDAGDSIREIYDWWKNYPNRKKEIELALDNWHETAFPKMDKRPILDQMKNNDTPEVKRYASMYHTLEKNLLEEEEVMLVKVMKIRSYLWT